MVCIRPAVGNEAEFQSEQRGIQEVEVFNYDQGFSKSRVLLWQSTSGLVWQDLTIYSGDPQLPLNVMP